MRVWNVPRQVLDQLAEVDPLLGQVVEDQPLAAEQRLDVDQVHLQLPPGDEGAAGRHALPLALGQACLGRQVLGLRDAEDLPPDRVLQELRRVRSVDAQRTSPSSVPRSVRTTTRCPRGWSWSARPAEFAERAHLAVANDVAVGHLETASRHRGEGAPAWTGGRVIAQ
jgi:hypothetical protein